jgi:hypothetical protein
LPTRSVSQSKRTAARGVGRSGCLRRRPDHELERSGFGWTSRPIPERYARGSAAVSELWIDRPNGRRRRGRYYFVRN